MTDEQKAALPEGWVCVRGIPWAGDLWLVARKIGGLAAVSTALWYDEGKTWHLDSVIDLSLEDLQKLKELL